MKQLPAALADPIAVFGSDSVAGRLVFMVDVTDANGATVVLPVQLDAKKNKDTALIHIVTSAYSKEKKECRTIAGLKYRQRICSI